MADDSEAGQSPDSVRLGLLELTRTTEQVAILASYALGRSQTARSEPRADPQRIFEKTLRKLTCEAFLRCVAQSLTHRARLVHIDPPWRGYIEGSKDGIKTVKMPKKSIFAKAWKDHKQEQGYGRLLGLPDNLSFSPDVQEYVDATWGLDLLMSPIDGVVHLLQGYQSGSMSIVAGGREGAFGPPCTDPPDTKERFKRFFVVAIRDEDLAEVCRTALLGEVNRTGEPLPIQNVPELGDFFESFARRQPPRGDPDADLKLPHAVMPTIATINEKPIYGFAALLRRGFVRRVFHGSPTAAAMTVLMGRLGTDLFAGVVRETNAFLIATAARSVGGYCFAIELHPPPRGAKSNVLVCQQNAKVYREKDFVKDIDVFIAVTGITAHPLLQGVRILPNGVATTQTLVLNARSQTCRTIQHDRDLKSDMFCSLGGKEELREAWQVIEYFRAQFESKGGASLAR